MILTAGVIVMAADHIVEHRWNQVGPVYGIKIGGCRLDHRLDGGPDALAGVHACFGFGALFACSAFARRITGTEPFHRYTSGGGQCQQLGTGGFGLTTAALAEKRIGSTGVAGERAHALATEDVAEPVRERRWRAGQPRHGLSRWLHPR